VCGRGSRGHAAGEKALGAITLTWAQVLVVVLAAVGLYVIEMIAFMRSSRRQAAQEQRVLARVEALQGDLGQMQERIGVLEAAVEGFRRGPQSSGQYREAVEMAERGSDSAAVADNCGISRAEADLIVALYRSRVAGNP
jgi:hypothetical protein